MPSKKTAKANGAAPAPITGYIRSKAPRYGWVEYRPDDLPEHAEPLRVKIRINLSIEELNAIPMEEGTLYEDQWAAIAPYVAEWNVLRENHQTGELEQVPPPAEAGPDAFKVLDYAEALWVAQRVRYYYAFRLADEKKASTASEPTPEPSPASDSTA